MSLVNTVIKSLAAVAVGAVLLSGCTGQGSPEAPASTPAPTKASQEVVATPSPSPSAEAPEQAPVSYRLALVDLRWSDALDLRVVEAVMADGSTEPYERSDRTWLVRVSGVKAPETGQCGAEASYDGAVALLNQLHGQEAGLVWGPQVREEVLPTYVFEATAAEVDAAIEPNGPRYMALAVDGSPLGARLVSEGLAHADGDEYAAEQSEAQAASRGIWAQCPAAG